MFVHYSLCSSSVPLIADRAILATWLCIATLMDDNLGALNDELSELLNSRNGCQYLDELDVPQVRLNGSQNNTFHLNVLHLNIRSLHKNKDNLMTLLHELRDVGVVVHVIGLYVDSEGP